MATQLWSQQVHVSLIFVTSANLSLDKHVDAVISFRLLMWLIFWLRKVYKSVSKKTHSACNASALVKHEFFAEGSLFFSLPRTINKLRRFPRVGLNNFIESPEKLSGK